MGFNDEFTQREVKSHCFGCTNRKPGCHGKCPMYAEYRKRLDNKKAKERLEKARSDIFWPTTAPRQKERKKK